MSNEKQKRLLITFFGMGKNYQETTYFLENKEKTTKYIADALNEFLNPDKVLIFTTQEAIDKNNAFKEEIEEKIGKDKTETVLVPSGKDQKEQEEIFKKVLEEVKKYNKEWEIYVDITHTFRPIPLVFFISLFYLKNFYNIKTSRIFYGNFEQRDENNRSPVIELTFLLDIVDWFNSVNMFVKRYEANELAHKLKLMVDNEKFLKLDPEQKNNLINLSEGLRKFSGEYLNVRAVQFERLLVDLNDKLSKSKPIINENLPILSPLIDKVQTEIENLQTPEPDTLNMDTLRYRIKLIYAYLRRNLALQAILLLREVFVDYLILKVGDTGKWLDYDYREKISDTFNKPDGNNVDKDIAEKIKSLQKRNSELRKIWKDIKYFRNNLAHCGIGKAEKEDLSGLKNKIENLTEKFEAEIRKG
ncbi:TIGR02221 family CRISPR-associated protein [Sulfurihydrogenibium sp.]|jgi:CRISPR-associated DxTHG motif protein|uniref:TIGR02221 family CRISPR-associated protein n=1 Tax=Sulfurihydrogenibium sp. TaxID=2053621 RepID=UPI0026245CBE|nr:TIGR02221 family CRISPR-associated protein [Sulfurihydrogenibium sp.]